MQEDRCCPEALVSVSLMDWGCLVKLQTREAGVSKSEKLSSLLVSALLSSSLFLLSLSASSVADVRLMLKNMRRRERVSLHLSMELFLAKSHKHKHSRRCTTILMALPMASGIDR
ncbi:hypothetical protein C0Q70_12640, partial [Pomacea canaliculata]